MFGRTKVAALVAEFLGVAILTTAVLSIVLSQIPFSLFTAMAAGLALGLMVLAIGPISGAHINPAVTLGLWTIRKVETTKALVYIAAQVLGGVAAWQLNEYLWNNPISKSSQAANWDWRVFIAEAIGTFVFTFGIAAAVQKKFEGLQAAAAIGGSLFLGVLIASGGSSAILNPAVAIGVQSYDWVYLLGPVLGAVVGMNLYTILAAEAKPKASVASSATTKKSTAKKKRK
jgi:glycerol uptake facilitator-like aquaporin